MTRDSQIDNGFRSIGEITADIEARIVEKRLRDIASHNGGIRKGGVVLIEGRKHVGGDK